MDSERFIELELQMIRVCTRSGS